MYHEWRAEQEFYHQPTQKYWSFVQLLAVWECAGQRELWDSSERARFDQGICSASAPNLDKHKGQGNAERREDERTTQAYLCRVGIAFAGGKALLIPMTIIVNGFSRVATLSTTVACVALLALALTAHFLTEYKDVLQQLQRMRLCCIGRVCWCWRVMPGFLDTIRDEHVQG